MMANFPRNTSILFAPIRIGNVTIPNRFVRSATHGYVISMARFFIREPYLVHKFRTGEIDKSECISCSKCFNLRGIRCAELARAVK